MTTEERLEYRDGLKEYDKRLASALPLSQPATKYAGWGTNLSRCGTEVAVRLTAPGGICGTEAPASLLSDQATAALRRWLVEETTWLSVDHYPAETRLFEAVLQPCVAVALQRSSAAVFCPVVTRFGRDGGVRSRAELPLSSDELRHLDYSLPVEFDRSVVEALQRWKAMRTLGDLERRGPSSLWLGRELDETGHDTFLADADRFRFLRGRMVGRFAIVEQLTRFVREELRVIPESASHTRVAWRDVSRRSQARRMPGPRGERCSARPGRCQRRGAPLFDAAAGSPPAPFLTHSLTQKPPITARNVAQRAGTERRESAHGRGNGGTAWHGMVWTFRSQNAAGVTP